MTPRRLAVVAATLLLLFGCGQSAGARRSGTATSTSSPARTSVAVASREARVDAPSNRTDPRLLRIGFRTPRHLRDHYRKHGHEFGDITEQQYLRMAQALRDAPLSRQVIEAMQATGTVSRFDRRSGAFIAFDTDLTIRTFFRPDDGEEYFRRAARRRQRG